jgi:hypothetical protein
MVTIPGRPNHLANLAISVVVAKIQPATSADFASQLSKKSESSFRAHDRNAYALKDSQLAHTIKFEPPNKHGFRAQASSLRLKKDSRRRLHSRGARRSERELRASPVRATRRGCSRARAERRRRPPASRRTSASPRLERGRDKKDAHGRRAFSPRPPGAPTRRAPAARRAIDSRVASRS